jgi:hypothetical protein
VETPRCGKVKEGLSNIDWKTVRVSTFARSERLLPGPLIQNKPLEGNVIVSDAYVGVVGLAGWGALVVAGGVGFGVAAAGCTFASRFSAEEGELVDEDLGLVLFLAAGLVVPGAGLDLAFDEDLRALFDVVADDLGGALEADDIVPLGLVCPVALGIFLPVGSGQREAGDGHAAGGGTDLGVFADVAEEEDFIDALCHVKNSGGVALRK